MTWNKNDLVVHTKKSEWGVGKVLDINSIEIAIFFVGAGHKIFRLPALLEVAPAELHKHPLLANSAPSALIAGAKFIPLSHCVKTFTSLFPMGFDDPSYASDSAKVGERRYKVLASLEAKELLNQQSWSALLDQEAYSEVCRRLAKVESKTNLLHSFEKIKWHAALKDESQQEAISRAFFDDVYGPGERASRFQSLAGVLNHADGCAKWTIASYYGFLLHPSERIFIKPEVTKFAAEACGWDLQYDSSLNWNTMRQAELMAQYFLRDLPSMGLRPIDMIDVQSFIWCIDPKSYGS